MLGVFMRVRYNRSETNNRQINNRFRNRLLKTDN
jgi:hypothetical protein